MWERDIEKGQRGEEMREEQDGGGVKQRGSRGRGKEGKEREGGMHMHTYMPVL